MINKKGITPISLAITIVLIVILVSIVTIYTGDILTEINYKKKISEFFQVQETVKSYNIRKNGELNFGEVTLIKENLGTEQQVQFDEEFGEEDTATLYEVNLSVIDAEKVNYGTLIDGEDRYLFSKETNTLYYEKGFVVKSKVYYKITDELMEYIK